MPDKKKHRAVFLDRDGVVNTSCGVDEHGNPECPLKLEDLMIYPYVGDCVKRLNDLGFLVFIVTNQPAVAKGKMTFDDLAEIHAAIYYHIAKRGGSLRRIYSCLHHPDPLQVKAKGLLQNCACRKPKPGMLIQASAEHDVDLTQSWMIGDSWKDILAGNEVGCETILIRPTEFQVRHCLPDFAAYTLTGAVEIIENEEKRKGGFVDTGALNRCLHFA